MYALPSTIWIRRSKSTRPLTTICFALQPLWNLLKGKIYTDLCGCFPVTLYIGMHYTCVAYVYKINVLLMQPMKIRADGHMVELFKSMYDFLRERNLEPNVHALDNEYLQRSNCLLKKRKRIYNFLSCTTIASMGLAYSLGWKIPHDHGALHVRYNLPVLTLGWVHPANSRHVKHTAHIVMQRCHLHLRWNGDADCLERNSKWTAQTKSSSLQQPRQAHSLGAARTRCILRWPRALPS